MGAAGAWKSHTSAEFHEWADSRQPDQGQKLAFTVTSTRRNHSARCSGVLVITILNVSRTMFFTQQNSRMHFFQSRSSGSPKTRISRSGSVFEVLKMIAVRIRSKPMGTPSPLSPSLNL